MVKTRAVTETWKTKRAQTTKKVTHTQYRNTIIDGSKITPAQGLT